ncbi:MAG: HlyC/CorC family transporter [Spirochaetes bacterium]|nr:HlyC/CorC family transporter [Spirochaetota bacterium]
MMIIIYEILIIIFILMSMFFSSAETAVISANRYLIEYQSQKKVFGAVRSLYILDNVDEVISMILIGNNIANITAAVFILYVAETSFHLQSRYFFLISIAQAVFFLVFCEIYPKVIARSKAETILKILAYPITFFLWVFKPIVGVSLVVSKLIKKLLHFGSSEFSAVKARDEINVLFNMGEKSGIVNQGDNYYVKEILSLHKIIATEVMTPTIDIVSVEIDEPLKNVVRHIRNTKFSRIAVYDDRVDNIVGFVYFRDIFEKQTSSIRDIMIKAVYVPSTKKIYKLYREMVENDDHIVFVVNEYGGVEGLITREDIAEEIVGEIQTKGNYKTDMIIPLGQNKYELVSILDIDYFDNIFKVGIKKQGFETVAGFVLHHFGYIPKVGEKFTFNNFIFTVEAATELSVSRVSVRVPKGKKISLRKGVAF